MLSELIKLYVTRRSHKLEDGIEGVEGAETGGSDIDSCLRFSK